MSVVRSRRLWGATPIAAGATTLCYTVPALRTAIHRSLLIVNTTAVNQTATVRLAAAGQAIWSQSVPANGAVQVPYFVANPGDTIYVQNAGVTGNLLASGYGSLLDGAPM